jgi:molybdate transport system permease protein
MPTWASLIPVVAVTLKLAGTTTAVLLAVGTPLAWWLSRHTGWAKDLVASLTALPIVLPPTVLGFYLLLLLGPHGPVGQALEALNLGPLVFTFPGLVVGSVVYSLPFVVQPLQVAFEAIGQRPLEAAATLRAAPLDRFWTVAVPLARSGFLTAAVLGFAHTVGEFGVVLMLGGSVPGKTRVLSIAIFEYVEASEYPAAHVIAGGMLGFALLALLALHTLNRRLRSMGA